MECEDWSTCDTRLFNLDSNKNICVEKLPSFDVCTLKDKFFNYDDVLCESWTSCK